MIRTFVIEELKRTFLPGVGAGALGAVLCLASKPLLMRFAVNALDTQSKLDVFVVILLALAASVGGTTAFSHQFRQGPLRLVENLPIARQRIWLVRLLVCLLTTVSAAGLLVVAQPSVIDVDREALLVAILTGILIFAAGVCWTMLIHAAGTAVALLNLVLAVPTFLILTALAETGASREGRLMDLAASTAAVCFVLLLVSFVVFMRGEFDVSRRRLLNGALLTSTLVGTLLALTVVADLGVFAYADEWHIDRSWTRSFDGRYLSLLLYKEFHYPITKAVVVDVESGVVVKTFAQNGLRQLLWRRDGSLLTFSGGSILERLLGLGTGTVRATRVFPDEQQLFRRRRSEFTYGFSYEKWGTFVAVDSLFPIQRWNGVTSLFRLDAPGAATPIVSAPWTSTTPGLQVWAGRDGFHFQTFTPPISHWIIGNTVRNVTHTWGPLYFTDEGAMKAVQAEFRKTSPGNQKASEVRGVYVWSEYDEIFDENSWLYFLEANASTQTARLLARTRGGAEWKEVLPGFQLAAGLLKQISQTSGRYMESQSFGLWTGSRNGLVVRIYRSGVKATIVLVNLVTGERFEIEDGNTWRENESQGVSVVALQDSLRITPYRILKGTSINQPESLRYRPGKGPPTAMEPFVRPKVTPPDFQSATGVKVYADPSGTFTAVSPDGTTRNLWPQ